jgi:hypothetical protein
MAARHGGWQRDPAKERHWRRLLRHWRRSRLSVRDFCDWQELAEPTFYFWRRELAKRDRETGHQSVATKCERRAPRQNDMPAREKAQFLSVQVVPETQAVATSRQPHTDGIEVHLPSGVRLHVPPRYDRQALIDVLAALETLPC